MMNLLQLQQIIKNVKMSTLTFILIKTCVHDVSTESSL